METPIPCAICSNEEIKTVESRTQSYCYCKDCGLRSPWADADPMEDGAGVEEWNKLQRYIINGLKYKLQKDVEKIMKEA